MQSEEEVVIEVSSDEDSSGLSYSFLEDKDLDKNLESALSELDINLHQGGKGVKLNPEQRDNARTRSARARTRSISSSAGSHRTGGKPDKTTDYVVRMERERDRRRRKLKIWKRRRS